MTASPRFRVRGALMAVAAGAAAVVVAGCGSSSGGSLSSGGGGTASTPIPSTSAPSPTGGVGRMPTSPPPGGGVGHGDLIQLKGVLERGAEPSCLVLRTSHGAYDLMGPVVQRLRPERTIVLLGRVVTGVASHCMDGTPFEVKAIGTR